MHVTHMLGIRTQETHTREIPMPEIHMLVTHTRETHTPGIRMPEKGTRTLIPEIRMPTETHMRLQEILMPDLHQTIMMTGELPRGDHLPVMTRTWTGMREALAQLLTPLTQQPQRAEEIAAAVPRHR